MAESPTAPVLYYIDPQPLTLEAHRDWRLKDGDASFTKDSVGMPVVIGEFADAARFYPVLFAAGENGSSIVLTGIDSGNLLVQDGQWEARSYVPAYVRRHPFVLMAVPPQAGQAANEAQNFALAIDAASNRFAKGGTEGTALFDGDQPSELTKGAMNFCSAYTGEAQATQEFIKALRDKGLLVDRRLDFTLPGDKKFGVDGFQTIDAQKLTDLDSATVVEWHRKGWLAACYAHLQSLARVNELLDRRARRAG